ncbi:MAG: hypothetical protein O2816_02020 [Planctomycetota bacterium]|nr:hypothetical protein [Planctomycetota bacterium]
MNLKPKLIALGLAAAALAPAATAQQPSRAGNWGQGAHQPVRAGQVSVHVGSHGYGGDQSSRRTYQPPSRSGGHVHGPSCHQTPGHYRSVVEQVWRPAHVERVWIPAQIEVSYDSCGRRIERVICPARWEAVHHPGFWEDCTRQVWVPAEYHCHSRGGGITPFPQRRYPRRH